MRLGRLSQFILLLFLGNATACYFPERTVNNIANYESAEKKKGVLESLSEVTPKTPQLENLCNNSQVLSEQIQISFPSTVGKECAWSEGPNLGKGALGVKVSAFREQQLEFEIPEDRIICGLNIRAKESIHRYNDAFLILMQNRMVASHSINSTENKDFLVKASVGEKVDRTDIIGLNHKFGAYCPDGVSCELSRSLGTGKNEIRISPEYLKYFALDELKQSVQFSFLVTGNRSITDCQHSGVELSLRYSYTKDIGTVAH